MVVQAWAIPSSNKCAGVNSVHKRLLLTDDELKCPGVQAHPTGLYSFFTANCEAVKNSPYRCGCVHMYSTIITTTTSLSVVLEGDSCVEMFTCPHFQV